MTDNLGDGIYLTSNSDINPSWDLEVDASGDIRTTSGIDELSKDTAYQSAINIEPEIGSRITPTVQNRLQSRVRDAFDAESRITSVISLNVREIGNDAVEITARVQANDEEVELVFEESI